MTEKKDNIVYLPKDALPDIEDLTGHLRMLAEIVGVEKALIVGQVFHCVPIRLWGVKKLVTRYRNACMQRDFDAGMTGEEVALKYGVGDRQTWNILGQPQEEKNKQQSLF